MAVVIRRNTPRDSVKYRVLKILSTFFVFFLSIVYFFQSDEIDAFVRDQIIDRDRVIAEGRVDANKMVELRKSHQKMRLFKYSFDAPSEGRIEGQLLMKPQDGATLPPQGKVPIAYSKKWPSFNAPESVYIPQQGAARLAKSFTLMDILASQLALPLTLFLSWSRGWLGK